MLFIMGINLKHEQAIILESAYSLNTKGESSQTMRQGLSLMWSRTIESATSKFDLSLPYEYQKQDRLWNSCLLWLATTLNIVFSEIQSIDGSNS